MDAHKIRTAAFSPLLVLSLALALSGCKSTAPATSDTGLTAQVQARLFADQNLGGQPIQASAANGIVTLSGSVSSDSARTIASSDAAQVPGVKTVVDNLVVVTTPPAASSVAVAAPTPAPLKPVPAPKGQKPSASIPQPSPAPIVRNSPAPQPAPQPAPAPAVAQNQPPPPPPPPPVPVVHNITLSAGTAIPVRITQTLDSATTQTGDKFTGAIASDIIIDGMVVLPQGTPVTGHVDAVQDAKHYKGSSLITISLTAITHKGDRIEIATDAYTKEGEGRGKNTAEKVGGGAAVGAILGGILGGGKGAAIGAAAGGGVGAGANTITKGQQVQIESETVVRFRLSDSIIVHVTSGSGQDRGPALEHHTDQ